MQVYICVHRPLAASLGFSIPRLCSASQRTSCLYAVCTSCRIIPTLYAPEPVPGQRYIHQLLYETGKVLGKRLQVSQHYYVNTIQTMYMVNTLRMYLWLYTPLYSGWHKYHPVSSQLYYPLK